MRTGPGSRRRGSRRGLGALLAAAVVAGAGCASQHAARLEPAERPQPDYSRPLPPGASALRPIDPSRLPDLTEAYRPDDGLLRDAVEQSLAWFDAPSSHRHYPFEGVSHEQARASLAALRDLLDRRLDADAFRREFVRLFDAYQSVGYDGNGVVLFTGYFAPIIPASPVRTSRFRVPIHRRPADLVTDPVTGEPQGRRVADGRITPYPTRREIERTRMFAGNELYWLEDELSAYIVHVNGSAKLRLPDGSSVFVGYAGKTDGAYKGLGRALLDSGRLEDAELSLASIRRLYRKDPELINSLILENDSYVFFTEYDGTRWPAGSLGVKVTSESSLATDKKIYPRGGLTLVDTRAATFGPGTRRLLRFMLDQDTGGAIKAPGRADIFMGIGSSAEILAGGQYSEGRLFYFFLKPEYVAEFATDGSTLAME
jgi:membrane-bound lytic murein transglycosylase A